MSNNNINMIFYSEHCNTCRNVMSLLKNENLLQNFKIICVDNILDKLPQDMQVPLMRLVNVPDPLHAQSIYNWISQIKFMRKSASGNTQVIQRAQKQTGPYCYDADVMSKISDNFAFADQNVNDPLPQSYFGINQEENNAIYTPKDPHGFKIKKDEQKKILSDIETKRNQQTNEFLQYSKQVQMELLTQDEYERQKTGNQIGNQTMSQPVAKPKPKGVTVVRH